MQMRGAFVIETFFFFLLTWTSLLKEYPGVQSVGWVRGLEGLRKEVHDTTHCRLFSATDHVFVVLFLLFHRQCAWSAVSCILLVKS